MIRKHLVLTAGAIALALGVPSIHAQDKPKQQSSSAKKAGSLSKEERNLFMRMAQSDMAEVEAGKVAAEKASSPEVKKYGQHMVDEHGKMLEEGKQLAQKKGIEPPKSTDRKHQAALKKLQGMSGEEFDRNYMQQMVKDHEDALELGEKTAKEAKDPELKAHAEKAGPHIKEHLAQARKLNESLGASAGGTTKKK